MTHWNRMIGGLTALNVFFVVSFGPATAAEIKVLCVPPLRSAMAELIPAYEKSSGHKITIEYGTPPVLADRVRKGEAIDVLIATRQPAAELQTEGKITGTVDVAKVGMGVAVRKGATKPDIGSVATFKRMLLDARSIAYIDPASGAPGAIYLTGLFDRLGIAADIKPKTKHFGPSGAEAAVAAGEAELALSQVTVISASAGVDLVGPLPAEIQNYLQFTGGMVTGSKNLDIAKEFIAFVSAPASTAIMKSKGFE